MTAPLYERIGRHYTRTRRADPRIQRVVEAALAGAGSIVNVGAGAGAYEPVGPELIAVEPSAQMRSLRPPGAARCVAAAAESLPLADDSVDMAMAVYTDFHWRDRRRGVAEMLRVSRRGVVILTVDGDIAARFWLTRDYLPSGRGLFAPLSVVTSLLPGPPVVTPVPVPHDCRDGFIHAFWRRPAALLDADVRRGMAMFARAPEAERSAGLAQLAADLGSGAWRRHNAALAGRESLDLGHRLVVWRPEQ